MNRRVKDLRAASVQFQHVPGDKEANLATVREWTAQAAAAGAELVIFPEMCLTGYWHLRDLPREALDALAEPVPDGESTQALLALAAEYQLSVGAGFIERDADGRLFNSYVVAMPDGRTACHRKLHAFINEHISSGSDYTLFDLPNGTRAGILICYDCNLGENVRINAMILDPYGDVLAETWKADDDMVVADLQAETRAMCTGVRWIRSRRPELYKAVSTPTGREQDIRTVRFSTANPEASNRD